jgi:hypothetical protein
VKGGGRTITEPAGIPRALAEGFRHTREGDDVSSGNRNTCEEARMAGLSLALSRKGAFQPHATWGPSQLCGSHRESEERAAADFTVPYSGSISVGFR